MKITLDFIIDQVFKISSTLNKMDEIIMRLYTKILMKNTISTLNNSNKAILKNIHAFKNNQACNLLSEMFMKIINNHSKTKDSKTKHHQNILITTM